MHFLSPNQQCQSSHKAVICLLLHPVLLCFLSSVCMLYVYGCFGEINYDDDDDDCERMR